MPEIDLRPGFFMFAIVLAALDRSGSVLPILYAMGVHELAHVVMMLACGGRVRRLTLRFADLRIDAAGLGYRQELLAALAGPLVNLICGALFCMRSPAFAAYSLMLGIYNLLPVWPLDGGRAELVRAARQLAAEVQSGVLTVDQIDEQAFADHLYTAGLPDVDLLIRTSGEMRLSNFLLFQCSYAEFLFPEKLWPDFHVPDLHECILQFQSRDRRYGGRQQG